MQKLKSKKIKQSTVNNNATTASLSTIQYTGIVKVSVQDKKNRTVTTRKSHNTGSKYLFEFLARCLGGQFSAAREILPIKICLLANPNGVSVASARKWLHSAGSQGSGPLTIATTGFISAYGTNAVNELKENYSEETAMLTQFGTTLHFRIPYAFITDYNICGVLLFNDSYTGQNIETSWSAYYLFTKPDPVIEGQEDWSYLKLVAQQNYTLLIDWLLAVGNGEFTLDTSSEDNATEAAAEDSIAGDVDEG